MNKRVVLIVALATVVFVTGYASALDYDVDAQEGVTDVVSIDGIYYDSLQEAIDTIEIGETATITVEKSYTENQCSEIDVGQNVILDLNGKVISVTEKSSGTSYYVLINYGQTIIIDSSADESGKLSSRGIQNKGILTLESGTVSSIDSNGGGAAVWNEGTFYMNGGTLEFTGKADGNSSGITLNSQPGSWTYIYGGNLKSTSSVIFVSGELEMSPDKSEVTVEGGMFYFNCVKVFSGARATITGVTINATDGGCIEVNGGEATLTDCILTEGSSEGSATDWNSNCVAVSSGGTVTVSGTTMAGSANYGFYVYNSGGTINIESGTYTVNGSLPLIRIDNVSIFNNAEVNISGGKFTQESPSSGNGSDKLFYINSNANCSSGVTITGDPSFEMQNGGCIFYINTNGYGNVDVQGGTFSADADSCDLFKFNVDNENTRMNISAGSFDVGIPTDAGIKVSVTGGSFTDGNVESYYAKGYESTAGEDGMYVPSYVSDDYVASNGNVRYESLANALANASEGDTVSINKDIEMTEVLFVTKDVTIDLAGATVSGSEYAIIGESALTIVGSGTIDSSIFGLDSLYLENITVNGIIAVASLEVIQSLGAPAPSLMLKDVKLNGSLYMIGAEVTIQSGTYVTDRQLVYIADSNLTIDGGTFSYDSFVGDYISTNVITINGGLFNNTEFPANGTPGSLIGPGSYEDSTSGNITYATYTHSDGESTLVERLAYKATVSPNYDGDEELPPFIPQQPAEDDDTTLYIACCAAAAVVALLAIIIVMNERKR